MKYWRDLWTGARASSGPYLRYREKCDFVVYRGGTLAKVRQKVERAVAFGEHMFPEQERRFEWWSPKAGPTLLAGLEELAVGLSIEETAVEFIVNKKYAQRVGGLFEDGASSDDD